MSSNSNNTPSTAQEARVLELLNGHLRLIFHINTHPRSPLMVLRQQAAAARPTFGDHYQASRQSQQQSETPVAQQPAASRVSYNEIHRRALLQHQQHSENPAAPQPTYDDPQAEALYQYLQQEWNHNHSLAEARYQHLLQQTRPSGSPTYDDPATEALFQGLVRRASEFDFQ